jgi:hypothetical protein
MGLEGDETLIRESTQESENRDSLTFRHRK